jgi:hypothetical protein
MSSLLLDSLAEGDVRQQLLDTKAENMARARERMRVEKEKQELYVKKSCEDFDKKIRGRMEKKESLKYDFPDLSHHYFNENTKTSPEYK